MNESTTRRRLREAFGESSYPPALTARVAARISARSERQRAGWVLAAVAAVLAVALVATILLAGHALHGRAVVPVKPPVGQLPAGASCRTNQQIAQGSVIKTVVMMTPTLGWASGGQRTTDGGVHWQKVLPKAVTTPSVPRGVYARAFAEFYLDADRAWVLRTYATSKTCLDHADVWSTLDGGATWAKAATVVFALPPDYGPAGFELTFLDDRRGWLWATVGPVNGPGAGFVGVAQAEAQLFATVDGGSSWRLVSTITRDQIGLTQPNICVDAFGHLNFSDATTAWMGFQCGTGGVELVVTHDGGASWNIETVPLPCDCGFSQLRFFDSRNGIIELNTSYVYYGPAALLATSDGGRTWHVLPAIPNAGNSMAIDYLDTSHWFDLVALPGFAKGDATNDSLYRTDDGGQTWTLVQAGLPLGFPVYQMVFFDATHGWAMQVANNTRGLPPDLGKDEILVTSDGGHTWTLIATIAGSK